MASDGRVVFEIDGDNRNIKNVLHDTTNSIEQESKKWDNAGQSASGGITSSFTSALTKIGSAFAAAKIGQKLMEFGSQAIEAASDLREVQNVVDVTFGESASTIESWSKTAQSQFGLTETQAKRFASTLGAMMKSSGLAGEEIVGMSTDLAGLAADMASFYNLDFDTAFQKIRSGISGETEPLKQLGINMSVANLEAYALTQGITKAFDQMSQGEQTMLRYQYLMQATADAQGDFARTADGYANSQRRITTAIESVKTTVGNFMMEVVEPLSGSLADLLEQLTKVPERTVLDEFEDIDKKAAGKVAEVEESANKARALVMVLEDIDADTVGNLNNAANAIGNIGTKAKMLDGSEEGKWSGLLGTLATADPKAGLFGSDALTAATNISKLATALSSKDPSTKKQAWTDMLSMLKENVPAVSELAKQSPKNTMAWLDGLAASAAKIDPNDPKAWGDLFDELVDGLPGLAETEIGATFLSNLQTLAKNSNLLNAGSASNWSTLLTALNEADTTKGIFGEDAAGRITAMSDALASSNPTAKKAAWEEMLGVLQGNASAISELTGKSVEDVTGWLKQLEEATPETGDNLNEWNTLLTSLAEGFSSLDKDGLGTNFLESLEKLGAETGENSFFQKLADGFKALGGETSDVSRALQALGIDTSGVEDKQAVWLKTCQELVKTIPGLSDIIDTQTGKIKGGVEAVIDYVNEWEAANKKMIAIEALKAKEEAVTQKRAQVADYEWEKNYWRNRVKLFEEGHEDIAKLYREEGIEGLRNESGNWLFNSAEYRKAINDYIDLMAKAGEAEKTYNQQTEALELAEDKLKYAKKSVEDMTGDVDRFKEKTEGATEATQQFAAAQKEVENAVKAATSALEEVEKYYDNAFKGIEKALESSHTLFGSVETPAQKAKKEIQSLEAEKKKLLKDKKDTSTIELKLQGAHEAEQSIDKMTAGLKQQIAYYQNYASMMERARQLGYSEDVLSSLADGSAESYDYLAALTADSIQKGDKRIEELNNSFKQAASERESLTKQLTDQALSTDQAFQSLVQSASDAIAGLNLGEQASSAMQSTVQGIADGIAAKIPAVQKQVNALNAVLNRLNKAGGFSFGSGILTFSGGRVSKGLVTAEPLAIGMDYVPFDNFLAALHEGESVLTAEEAKLWRDFKYGGAASRNSIDYDALGATVRDNVHAGGNVYLDGQTVGRVISARQADSYRALERSGYQQ